MVWPLSSKMQSSCSEWASFDEKGIDECHFSLGEEALVPFNAPGDSTKTEFFPVAWTLWRLACAELSFSEPLFRTTTGVALTTCNML